MTALSPRAVTSPWVSAEPGLAEAVREWSAQLARSNPAEHAAEVARLGPLHPLRSLRYLTAYQVANAQWAAGQLRSPGLQPIRDPGRWAKQSVAEVLRRQLSLMGPAGAEVARIIAPALGCCPMSS